MAIDQIEILDFDESSLDRFERVRQQFNLNASELNSLLAEHDVTYDAPEVNIGDKTVKVVYRDGIDYADYEIGIYIDETTEISFMKHRNIDKHLIRNKDGDSLPESHEIYLSASELIRIYLQNLTK